MFIGLLYFGEHIANILPTIKVCYFHWLAISPHILSCHYFSMYIILIPISSFLLKFGLHGFTMCKFSYFMVKYLNPPFYGL